MKKVLQPEGLNDLCLLHMCKVSMDRCLKFGSSLLLHPYFIYASRDMCGFRGGRGSGPPFQENHKAMGSLAILVRIHWKITKLPSQQSILGHHQPDSEMPFKCVRVKALVRLRIWDKHQNLMCWRFFSWLHIYRGI